jgi:hypothetical protein
MEGYAYEKCSMQEERMIISRRRPVMCMCTLRTHALIDHSIVSSPSHTRASERTFFTVLARWSHHGRLASSVYFPLPLPLRCSSWATHTIAIYSRTAPQQGHTFMLSFIHAWCICTVTKFTTLHSRLLCNARFYFCIIHPRRCIVYYRRRAKRPSLQHRTRGFSCCHRGSRLADSSKAKGQLANDTPLRCRQRKTEHLTT